MIHPVLKAHKVPFEARYLVGLLINISCVFCSFLSCFYLYKILGPSSLLYNSSKRLKGRLIRTPHSYTFRAGAVFGARLKQIMVTVETKYAIV
jgi:hypothetical protein